MSKDGLVFVGKIIDLHPIEGADFIVSATVVCGEGVYSNGKQREGVVIRSQENHGHAPISFKVINLGFEK